MDDRDFSLFAAPPPKKPSTLLLRTEEDLRPVRFPDPAAARGGRRRAGGLVFVYSSDLPQVQQLEDYRPDVMTELYADDGTPIGSFALERRVIVTYDQIPPVLRDAIISIEDRHFESHWGVDVVGIVRAGHHRPDGMAESPGRQHADHATQPPALPDAREELGAQSPGSPAGHPDRAALHQSRRSSRCTRI